MYRWSKIPETHRPEIVSDVNDDRLLTLVVQDWSFKKIKRKDTRGARAAGATRAADATRAALAAADATRAASASATRREHATLDARRAAAGAWEGSYYYQFFKNIIDKNIPCTVMHKAKNKWASEIDTIVCFMTGDTLDVFLVHPNDLTEWDPNDQA